MLQLDRDVAATIVRLVHDLTGFHAIICDERATIVADSAGTRLGQAHEGARRILQGQGDTYRVTAAEATASGGKMKEGLNRAIRDGAHKVGTFGIAGPLAVVEPIANLAAEIVLVRLADKARDALIKGALQQCIDDTNRAVGTAAVSVHQLNSAFDGLAASSDEMVRVAQRSAEHLRAIAQMLEMILSQMMNPSVGAYCNAIMVYFYCVRAFPDVMLDVMETIVDAAQQGYDLASFEAITKETDSIWNQLVHKCETDPTIRIEAALATAKMPARIQHKVQDRIVKGRFSRMDVAYSKAIATLRNEIALTTLQWRYNSPLVRRLAEKPMDSKYVETCKKLYYKWTFALEAVDAKFKVSEFDHPFAKMVMQQNKQKAFHVIVNEMLEFFNNITDERDRYMLVVNLYKWIVLGQRQDDAKQKLGLRDRIFFQPNANGEKCLMRILIEGIKYFNLG